MTSAKITTRIVEEDHLRIHHVTGVLTKDVLLTELDEIYSMPGFQSDMNTLWDVGEADVSSFSLTKVQTIRDYVGDHWGNRRRESIRAGDL